MKHFFSILLGLLVLTTWVFTNVCRGSAYQQSVPPEYVHLQLSEEVIAAGQKLWFQGILMGDSATSTVLYVEVLNRQGAVWQGIYPIRARVARGSIYLPDTLSGGWYQLRAYTQWMRNGGVTSFCSRPLLVINEQTESEPSIPTTPKGLDTQRTVPQSVAEKAVEITLGKDSYRPRDSVLVTVRLPDPNDTAQLAISVRKVNPLSSYFPASDPSTWQSAGGDASFRREDESLTISGHVVDTDQRARGHMVTLWVPGNHPRLAYSFVKQGGLFHIAVDERLEGTQSAVLQMSDTSFRTQWTLDEKFAPENTYALLAIPRVPTSVLQEVQHAYAQRALINTQYGSAYAEDTATGRNPSDFRFYGAPNFTVYPDDYIALPGFDEIVREMLPGVQLREKNGRYYFKVFDIPTRTFLSGTPSVLLDGMLVHDLSSVVGMSPSDIARIETVNRRTYYGEYRLDGTVAIYTKAGDAYPSILAASAWHEPMKFYTPYHPFSQPDTLAPHEPDFRTLLYWQPEVRLGQQPHTLTFAQADELGSFEVVVAGTATDGRPIYARKVYTVSFVVGMIEKNR